MHPQVGFNFKSVLFHPLTRTFVCETNNIFLSVQELGECNAFEIKQEILNASKKYRCIIRECIQRLEGANQGKDSDIGTLCDVFYTIEICWHLCETLYLENIAGDVIIPFLIRWIQFHFVNHETRALKIMKYQMSDESSALDTETLVPDYWDTVFGLLCQGNFLHACKLVELHSKANTQAFSKAIRFLKFIPEFDTVGSQSLVEFEHSWLTLRSKVQSEIGMGTFSSDKNLEMAMRIITGDEDIDKMLRKHCASWYQYLVAKLLFSQPTIKSSQLKHYVSDAMTKYKVANNPELLNVVLSSLLRKELLETTTGILKMSDGGWCATHLTNLLQMANLIPANPQSNDRLDRKLIIKYGSYLIKTELFWQIGATYLKSCGKDGLNVLNLVLPEMDFKNELVARKVLTFAYQNNFSHVVEKVSTKLANTYMDLEQYVEALAWSIKGKNHDLATALADKFLEHYIKTGELELLDVVDNLGVDALFVDRLVFLIKFVGYFNCKSTGEFKEALSILLDLLVNNLVPAYFKVTHFMEILNLIKVDRAQVSKSFLTQILHSLEDYSSEFELVPLDNSDVEAKEKYEMFLKSVHQLRQEAICLYGMMDYKSDSLVPPM